MCCYALLLLLTGYDLWSTRKIHRATFWGSVFLIVLQHGKHPNTLKVLREANGMRERERENAAREALLKHMPDRAHAMTQTELFEKAGVITRTTGEKALKALLAEKKIQRIGAGGSPIGTS